VSVGGRAYGRLMRDEIRAAGRELVRSEARDAPGAARVAEYALGRAIAAGSIALRPHRVPLAWELLTDARDARALASEMLAEGPARVVWLCVECNWDAVYEDPSPLLIQNIACRTCVDSGTLACRHAGFGALHGSTVPCFGCGETAAGERHAFLRYEPLARADEPHRFPPGLVCDVDER